jgi:hypothetical protein
VRWSGCRLVQIRDAPADVRPRISRPELAIKHFPQWKVSPIFTTLAKHIVYIHITALGAPRMSLP